MAREDKAQRIILAIRGVGESYLAQQWGKEGAWGTQTIDAQRIVGTVLVGPLSVVDKSWWQGVQVEVAHAIRTDDHGCVLLVEGIYNLLQGFRRRVQVVAIQLHGKASATVVVYSLVPAATNTQIVTLGYDVDESLVVETT